MKTLYFKKTMDSAGNEWVDSNEKAKQLLDELEALGERSDLWHKDFWITRSPIGGYTVVSVKRTITEHFSNAQSKSLGKTLYEVKI